MPTERNQENEIGTNVDRGIEGRRIQICKWFALCDQEATGYSVHPILGPVPTCQPCQVKFDLTPCDPPTNHTESDS